jgi:glycosyltransferase involved in cell wall biosynthesis
MSPTARPTVSVIVPVYNGCDRIGHALRSVFSQAFTDFEVVVIDDGSTDALDEALAEWSDRIVFIRQPNRGPASARNTGVANAKGRLVAFLDADDEWIPEKLALQVEYFDRYPQTGLLHTGVIDDEGRRNDAEAGPFSPPGNVFCPLFHAEFFVRTLTVMAPRAVVLEAGGFDERREIHVEDWDLWLRIAARYPVGYLPQRLAIHRRGGHMSTAFEKTYAGQALVIDKHVSLCQSACAAHRAAPHRCLSDRRYVLHWSLAYERFRHGDRAGARRAFGRAIAQRPWQPGAYLRYLTCLFDDRWIAWLRSIRRQVGSTTPRTYEAAASVASPARGRSAERLTLANDTVYRRARRRTARLAHAVDDRVSRAIRARRRVLFEAASPMSFAQFQPVYRRLVEDPRLEFHFTAPGRAWEPRAIFAAVGISDRVITADQAAWGKWDVCINTDFWEMTKLRRRTRRVHLFHGVAGKCGLDAPVDLAPEIVSFACLMFPNEDRLRRYVDAGLVAADGRAAALVGYPKADALVDGSLDRETICAALRLDPRRPTVIYAPTWSPHSSLNVSGETIIDGLAAAGYQVIVKLHDRSYDRLPRGSGGVDWEARLARYHDHPRVRVPRRADATPLLFASDAMVTDHSSIGFEFLLLDRPLVIVDCPALIEHADINPEKVAQLRACADVVADAREVPQVVGNALADAWRHASARRSTADALFYDAGNATGRAVGLLYELLDLPGPQPQERCRTSELFVSSTV